MLYLGVNITQLAKYILNNIKLVRIEQILNEVNIFYL